jgi:hypothetical protein
MPPRTAAQILAEWHDLARQRDEASDAELAAAIAARIEQVRHEYIVGSPPEPRADQPATPARPTPRPAGSVDESEPTTQMRLPLT